MKLDFDEVINDNDVSMQAFPDGGLPDAEALLHQRLSNPNFNIIEVSDELRTQNLIDTLDGYEGLADFDLRHLDADIHIEYWSIILQKREGHSIRAIKTEAVAYFALLGLPAPQYTTITGLKNRLLCHKFWKRTLAKARDRACEKEQIADGRVCKNQQVYASDDAVKRIFKKRSQTAEAMAELYAVSDEGDVVNMASIIEHSIANPSVRHAELMVKMRGFEEYAQSVGHVNVFYTLTAPSKYHRYSYDVFNVRYDDKMSPRNAQAYLCRVWARIRACLARKNIKLYGVRVCEPHKDGCPHFHLSLFMRPEDVEIVNEEFKRYALEEDGDELGADEHRFKIVEVKSASSYIAKYISKNLGLSINDPDFDHVTYGERVSAWSSLWRIRQFQLIGGAPSGVWRELRKVREPVEDEALETIRQAVDQGDWAEYLHLMGGATVKRSELPISLIKTALDRSGEHIVNMYDETVKIVVGLCTATVELITRTKQWVIMRGDSSIFKSPDTSHFSISAHPLITWPCVNNCTQLLTTPAEENATSNSSTQEHDAHVLQYREHIRNLIVANYQEIQIHKAMDRFCVSHVEAFKKHLKFIKRQQDAHVRAYQKHLKRNAVPEGLTNDPIYGCDSIAA